MVGAWRQRWTAHARCGGAIRAGAAAARRTRRSTFLIAAFALAALAVAAPAAGAWRPAAASGAAGGSARKHATPPKARPTHLRKPAIINGHDAAPDSWPWVVFILRRDDEDSSFSCTGTVVARNVVLTAAHCAEDLTTGATHLPASYTVITGRLDLADRSTGQVLGVTRVIVDPAFDPAALTSDAALLVLARPTTSPAIPLATAADDASLARGTLGYLAGWGRTAADSTTHPTMLQSATTVLQSDADCALALGGDFDAASMRCTLGPPPGVATCHGDSGGPLLVQRADATYVEVGITSWNIPGCPTTSPDAFARVGEVERWVASQLTALTSEPAPPSPPTTPPAAAPAPPPMPGAAPARYHGTSSQGRPVRLWIADGGADVSSLTLDYTLRCRLRHRSLPMQVAPIPQGRPWRLSGRSFIESYRSRNGVSYRFAGVVRSNRLVTGAVRVTWRSPHYGRCSSGRIRFRATRG